MREDDTDALAATRTLGSAVMPQVLNERAREVRKALCSELQIQPGTEAALQGQLIAELATKMGDLDALVSEWLRRGSVPPGIRAPIEAGGVFPSADPIQAEVDTDLNLAGQLLHLHGAPCRRRGNFRKGKGGWMARMEHDTQYFGRQALSLKIG